jgi:hypothetical protein
MQILDAVAGLGGENGEAQQLLLAPAFPQAREGERQAVLAADVEGLFKGLLLTGNGADYSRPQCSQQCLSYLLSIL